MSAQNFSITTTQVVQWTLLPGIW